MKLTASQWKKIKITLFIVFNAGVILWTALSEFTGKDSAARFQDIKIKWFFLLPALGCWLLAVAAETYKYALLMKQVCGYVNLRLCAETVLLGRYYDNITPSGVGGQPFQIYYLKKNGIRSSDSAAIPLVGFVSMQFAFVILGILLFAIFSRYIGIGFVKVTSYVGLCFYAFFPTLILLFTFFEKTMTKLMHWFVYFLAKLKIIRNPAETYKNWSTNIAEYSIASKGVLRNGKLSLKVMGLALLYQVSICSIPFFVILAFGGEIGFITSLVNIVSIYATITFIPTPGNAGAAEGSFYAIFSMLTEGFVFWAMLTWRFFVFYLFIIVGLLIFLKNSLNSRKRKQSQRESRR